MLVDAFDDKEAYDEMVNAQLLKRVGIPEEIGHCALYLASDESGFTNGVSIMVDGGLHNSPSTSV